MLLIGFCLSLAAVAGNPYKFTDPDGRQAVVAEVLDRGVRRLFHKNEAADSGDEAGASAQPGDADSSEGCIYCVDGSKTKSDKDYIGSTDDMGRKEREASDGRDRKGADRVGSYTKGDRQGRRAKSSKQ